MKKIALILFTTFLIQGTALAQQDGRGKNLQDVKNKILQRIQNKKRIINAFESCVSSANSREALKACRQRHKAAMKNFRENNKQLREKFRDEKQRRKEDRKNQRDGL
jgi:thiamine kinase-like enzyme